MVRTRALIEERRGARMRDVVDLRERRGLNFERLEVAGEVEYSRAELALVHVDGEPEPRWIAVERLERREARRR